MNRDIIKNMFKVFLKDIDGVLRIFLLIFTLLGIFFVIVGIPFGIFLCISEIFKLGFNSADIMLFTLIFLICFGIICGYIEHLYHNAKNNTS